MRIITNNMAIIIVFRINGIWLFNLTLSHKLADGANRIMSRIKRTLAPVMYFAGIILMSYFIVGCDTVTNPLAKTAKATNHYVHFADTLWHDDMATWNNGDTLETDYHTALAWTSANVSAYQGAIKVFSTSLTYAKPTKTTSKAVYWDGEAVQIQWDRMPKIWDKVIIRFTDKEGK